MNYKMMNNKCVLQFKDTSDQRTLSDGSTIHLASYWDELLHTNQDAIIKAVPARTRDGRDLEVAPGDKVYVHHFICTPDHQHEIEGKKYAELDYGHIYCKVVDEEIQMIQDYILLERAYEDISTCMSPSGLWLKEQPDEMKSVGIVRHVNEHSADMGINIGDHVIYSRLSDYNIVVEGKQYIRMRNKDICAKYNIS